MAERVEREHEEDRGREDDRGASPPRRDEDRRDAPRDKRDGGETCSLLVRNLSYNVRPDEIRRIFIRYGDIRDVYIPTVSAFVKWFCIIDCNYRIIIPESLVDLPL